MNDRVRETKTSLSPHHLQLLLDRKIGPESNFRESILNHTTGKGTGDADSAPLDISRTGLCVMITHHLNDISEEGTNVARKGHKLRPVNIAALPAWGDDV